MQKNENREGYKATKAGWIPDGWSLTLLGQCSQFLDSIRIPIKAEDREARQGPYPYYGASGVIDFIDDYLFDDELILLGEDGANILTRASRLAFRTKGKIWVNNHAHVIKPNAQTSIGFLTEYLESISYVKYNTGTAQPKLNRHTCASIPIPLPLLTEQEAIADVLECWDKAIRSYEIKIDRKLNVKMGLMQMLLSGKRRLPGFSEVWSTDQIVNLAKICTGAKDTKDRVPSGEYPFFVRSQTPEKIDTYSFDGTAVLTAGDGNIGKIFHFIQGKFDFHQRVYKVSDFQPCLDPRFFFEYFRLNFIRQARRYSAKTSVDSVRMEMITKMEIPLPPVAEQKAISLFLFEAETEINKLAEKLTALKAQKTFLLNNLVTGTIRLQQFLNKGAKA